MPWALLGVVGLGRNRLLTRAVVFVNALAGKLPGLFLIIRDGSVRFSWVQWSGSGEPNRIVCFSLLKEPNRIEPNRTVSNRTEPKTRTEPNRTEPKNRTERILHVRFRTSPICDHSRS